ncbi:MAG TPA: cytosine permease, partial [Salinisphaeraceae bacterium]|nr:cytosine permease [Salinisphaeraceae bacterium]
NLIANFVAPNYMLCDLFPRWLTFRRAGLVTAIIGFIILPWNLYNSPAVIQYFLGGVGAILGPFFGLIMVDYWLIRRQKLNIPDLYSAASSGTYFYRNGFNQRAFYALLPAVVISLIIALVPAFSTISDFSWIFGAIAGGILHWLFAPKGVEYHHVEDPSLERPAQ